MLIEGERVAEIVDPGSGGADETIDASGLHVLPGVVDAHVHCNEPGRTEWEGFAAATAGAAAGGTTTIADMPLNSVPPTNDGAAFEAKRHALERAALVDVALWGGLVGADPRPLRELSTRGVVGVKAFMSDPGVPEYPRLDDATLAEGLAAAARLGLLVAVHAEDERATKEAAARLRGAGRMDPDAWLESRSMESERDAVQRLLMLAGRVSARVHLLHASAAAAVQEVRAARERGEDVSCETCPHYLVFTDEDARRLGPLLKCAPPIREAANREILWRLIGEGAIDLVASDHSPSSATLKATDDIWKAWGGVTGVQSLLAALLTVGVQGRGLPVEVLARLVATTPARRLGLYPRKGAIRPGADADLALVDLGREWTLEPATLRARSGVSPYLGRSFTGTVVRTLVRGRTVYRDGEVLAEPGYGRFVPSIGPSLR